MSQRSISPALPEAIFNPAQRADFRKVLAEVGTLYRTMCSVHEKCVTEGRISLSHSLDHDLVVAVMGHSIVYARHSAKLAAPSARLVVAAALMHSYDRLGLAEADVSAWMKNLDVSPQEGHTLYHAVIDHDKPNRGRVTDQPTVADVLADGDKLAILMFYSLIRMGQFLPNKPVLAAGCYSGMTPGANYKSHNVVLDNLFGILEWVDDKTWFVTPEAREIAKALEPPLRFFVEVNKAQFEAIGLHDLLM
jgi:hypothetical protein